MKKKIYSIFLLFYFVTFSFANLPDPSTIDFSIYTGDLPDWYGYIVRVADGDTFYIDFYSEKKMSCRVRGIDTPETVDKRKPVQYWGPEASAFAKKWLTTETIVRLDFEDEITDPFGRLLATPWIYKDGEWVNWAKFALETGNALFYPKYPMPIEMAQDYLKYQQHAIDNKLGMWQNPEKIENEICTSLEQLYNEYYWYRKAID
ncbi:MAG: thermonuclease family protein [Spirochaetales bacterium]|nr:thermonuclease family protein [Spirochaetales bacterium]